MNTQNFFENMVNVLSNFQAEYKRESEQLSKENKENLINSIIIAYDVKNHTVCKDFSNYSFGVDLPAGSIYREDCINLSTDFLFIETRAEMLDFCKKAVADGVIDFEDELDYFKNQDDAQKTLDFLKSL